MRKRNKKKFFKGWSIKGLLARVDRILKKRLTSPPKTHATPHTESLSRTPNVRPTEMQQLEYWPNLN